MESESAPIAVQTEQQTDKASSTEKKLTEYKIGDTIRGDKIDYIFYSNSNFLIFRNSFGNLGYSVRIKSPKVPQILTEFTRCTLEARKLLRGAYRKDYTNIAATCLNSALLSLDDNVGDHFEPVRAFIEERGPIEYVYGYGPGFMVYLNSQGVVAYEHNALPNKLIPVISEFHRLQHIAKCALQDTDKKEVTSILGSDLVSAFRSSKDTDTSLYFFSSKEFITNRSEALLRSKYIRSSVLSSFVLLLVLAPTAYYLKVNSINAWIIILGCIGGIVGATISIIQRGVSLTVNPFVPISHVVFQGVVRMVLGIVFGGLLIVASKANITLGILGDNIWSLFIFSVVAGFSERFIPDILDRIATETSVQTKS